MENTEDILTEILEEMEKSNRRENKKKNIGLAVSVFGGLLFSAFFILAFIYKDFLPWLRETRTGHFALCVIPLSYAFFFIGTAFYKKRGNEPMYRSFLIIGFAMVILFLKEIIIEAIR